MRTISRRTLVWTMGLTVATSLPVLTAIISWADEDESASPHPFDARPQPWQRQAEPVLSALTTNQSWCKVVLYSPTVIRHEGKFKMWYVGTSTASRATDMALGYAESEDGLHWTEHPNNPIATGQDIPWGIYFQTPFVLFDDDEQIYKLWFSSTTKIIPLERNPSRMVGADRPLGYATSRDGIQWKFHPEPIYESSRSPCVLKTGPRNYRMWMNVDYAKIYEFSSVDGIQWKRAEQPAILPSGDSTTCIYPYVLVEDDRYFMWYGCHRPRGIFEIFCATSRDGSQWEVNHKKAAFPSTRDEDRFDGRYTSIPSLISLADRYLLYYAARDLQNVYVLPNGTKGRDGSGVYAHIGVASIPK